MTTAVGIRREGRAFIVPASLAPPAKHKRSGRDHMVMLAYDGALICRCEASAFDRECWAVGEVRKAFDMTTETGLTVTPLHMQRPMSLIPSDSELSRMNRVAEIILAGGVDLPRELNTPEKVMAVMLKGRALGLDPTIAIEHIHYIDGHAVPDAQIMAGILARDVPNSKLVLMDEKPEQSCTMRLILPSRGIDASYTVTIDDADVRILVERDTPHQARSRDGGNYMTKPGGWVTFPRDRLRWHATKRLLKIYAPDVINGLSMYGVGDYEERGEPEMTYIDGHVVNRETGEIHDFDPPAAEQVSAPPPTKPAPPAPEPTNHGETQDQAAAGNDRPAPPQGATDSPSVPAPHQPDEATLKAALNTKAKRIKSTLGDDDWKALDARLRAPGLSLADARAILLEFEPEPPDEPVEQQGVMV